MSELRAIEKILSVGIEIVGGTPWSTDLIKKAKLATKTGAQSKTNAQRKMKQRRTTKSVGSKASLVMPYSNKRRSSDKRNPGHV